MHLVALSLPLASSFGFEPWMIGVVIPIVGLIFAGTVAISGMYFKHRQREEWHQTARLALEKGQPMPPAPDLDADDGVHLPTGVTFAEWQEAKRAESRRHELKGGLILLAIGIAIFLTLGDFVGHIAGGVLGGIGAALLVSVILDKMTSRPPSRGDHR